MRRLVVTLMALIAIAVAADPVHDIAKARELTEWVNQHVEYVRSPHVIKTPASTLLTGGDCADMSGLLIWLLADEGIKASMLLLDLDDFAEHHAVVSLYGHIYDPTTGRVFRERFPLPHRIGDSIGISNLLADWEGRK